MLRDDCALNLWRIQIAPKPQACPRYHRFSQSRLVTPAAIAGLHNGFAERLIGLIRRECVDAPLPYASLLPYAGSEVDRSSKGCGAQYGTRDQRRYDITDNSFVQAQLNGTRARRKMPPSTATRSPSRERRPAPVTR
jgi:hypothetical protein